MIETVAGSKVLPAEVMQQIVVKTDGVPLFIEELTKNVLESVEATHASPSLAIPATLHDSLMARLDRLAAAKEVAQLGATLGREFSYELLQAVSPLNEATLQQGLSQLVEAELVYQRGLPPQVRYFFKHALIQDAAYQSLLKSKRQQYHSQIAQVLEEQFPETQETQPELLAHHYTEAGFTEQAIPYWQRAGQKAVERSANLEAISHLTKGLELLKTLRDTPERTQQELMLQITLGAPLQVTKGYTVPEVGALYSRACELCRQVGETSQLFPALRGLWQFYLLRAELQTAHELGEQLLSLTNSVQDPALLPEIRRALGEPLLWLGEFAPARVHLEEGITLYNPQQHRSHALVYGLDPGVLCLSFTAIALWSLGYPDQALTRGQEALALAQGLFHPPSLAFALLFAAWLHWLRREGQTVRERAEEMITLCTEQGFAWWLEQGTILQGWALAEHGQGEEGIVQIRQGLAAHRARGTQVGRTTYLALLTAAYEKGGWTEEGLVVLAEALAAANNNGERWCEAELYRLKGTLTLQSKTSLKQVSDKSQTSLEQVTTSQGKSQASPEAEAEECFWKAIAIARKQQAKSLELRAVMSLSRLWQQQGKQAEARQLLAEIYNWFTEGFDTKDLQETKALLAELAEER
jgi:predicted ATPase